MYSATPGSDRERTNLAVDVRLGFIDARGVGLSGQAIVRESTVLPPVLAMAGFGAGRKYRSNDFEDRAQDIADDAFWLVENLDGVQLAQLKRQLIIVAKLYAIADDQQVAMEVCVIGRQPVIKGCRLAPCNASLAFLENSKSQPAPYSKYSTLVNAR
jgi:hypothetical protein